MEKQDARSVSRDDDAEALDRLFPIVYEELRRIAHRQLGRERPGHTLNTTALVHETYLRLVDQVRIGADDRAHFLALAARAMRRILVDHARSRATAKRGGEHRHVSVDETALAAQERAEMLVALDDALTRLSAFAPRLGQVVECRFFGGLTEEETAEALEIATRTVRRDWVKAKGLLYEEVHGAAP